jgi:hypothetical protein
MRYLLLAIIAMSSTVALADPGRPPYPDYVGPVKYPAGTSLAAIADNERVRASIVGTPGIVPCYLIDTRTGQCRQLLVLDAGGGGGGDGGGAGAGGAGQ